MARPTVLVIGGSDSSGGAGVARDLRVLADFGVDVALAVTAVTAQTDTRVHAVHHVPANVLRDQIASAFASRPISAVKIGMLGTREAVAVVARRLPPRDEVPIVIDPVRVSSSGQALTDDSGFQALRELLLPRVTLVTPNLPEAAALLGESAAEDEAAMEDQARRIAELGAQAVLLKGGHAEGVECVDVLFTKDFVRRLTSARVPATMRGTGCALASAIAGRLASGADLWDACSRARQYVIAQLSDLTR